MRRLAIFPSTVLLCSIACAQARAQAHPGCPAKPQTLAAMRGCYRPLLVFAPAADDSRVRKQQAVLDGAADDMMDRDVLYLLVLPSGTSKAGAVPPPLDAPYATLSATEAKAARRRFHAAPGSFAVVLLGEDGGAKLSSRVPVSAEALNGLIDSMPTRLREMQRPHSN